MVSENRVDQPGTAQHPATFIPPASTHQSTAFLPLSLQALGRLQSGEVGRYQQGPPLYWPGVQQPAKSVPHGLAPRIPLGLESGAGARSTPPPPIPACHLISPIAYLGLGVPISGRLGKGRPLSSCGWQAAGRGGRAGQPRALRSSLFHDTPAR